MHHKVFSQMRSYCFPIRYFLLMAVLVLMAMLVLMAQVPAAFAQTDHANLSEDSPENPPSIYDAQHILLENGLEVIVVTNKRMPIISQHLFYRVGGMDDPVGKSGLAHLLEHMMFKGTISVPDGNFSQTISRLGGRDNAFTSQDYTGYFQTAPAAHLETLMRLESDRMRNLNFDHADFQASFLQERNVVIEERAQRTENNPGARLVEQADPAFYLNHPYRKPIIGWPGELEGLQLSDARAFYDRFYHPNNAVLILVGDVDAGRVFELARKYYGSIPRAQLADLPLYGDAVLAVESQVTLKDANVGLAQYGMRIPADSYGALVVDTATGDYDADNQARYRDLLALELGLDMIAHGASSPLYRRMVVDQSLAVAVGGYARLDQRGPGHIGFYLVPAKDISLEEASALMHDAITDIVDHGLDQSMLDRARIRAFDRTDFALDGLTGPARAIGQARMLGIPLSRVETMNADLAQLTLDQIRAVLVRHLAKSGRLITKLLPLSVDQP